METVRTFIYTCKRKQIASAVLRTLRCGLRAGGAWTSRSYRSPSLHLNTNAAVFTFMQIGLEHGFERDGSCTRGQSLKAFGLGNGRTPGAVAVSEASPRPSEPPRERFRRS